MLSLTNRLALNQITETIEKGKATGQDGGRESERERERRVCWSSEHEGNIGWWVLLPAPRLPFELV